MRHKITGLIHLLFHCIFITIICQIDETTESPSGGTIVKDANGFPTGQLFEEPAIMAVMANAPLPDAAAMETAFRDQWMAYAEAGITTVTDLAYMPTPEMDAMLTKAADDLDNFPIRLGKSAKQAQSVFYLTYQLPHVRHAS